VLSRTNIEEIIKFAHKEELFILADEVRKKWTTTSSGRLEHLLLPHAGSSLRCSHCCTKIYPEALQVFVFKKNYKQWVIHLVVCLTTGPKPLPKRALHIV